MLAPYLSTNVARMKAADSLTKSTLVQLQKLMRSRDYTYKRIIQSASAEWRWTKGDKMVELGGWHGNQPAKWGAGMFFFSLSTRNIVTCKSETINNILVMPGQKPDEYLAGVPCHGEHLSDTEWQVYYLNIPKLIEWFEKNT